MELNMLGIKVINYLQHINKEGNNYGIYGIYELVKK